MNRYSYLVLVLGLAACSSEKDSQEGNERAIDFSYELDTIMVDAGDEFIHVNWQLTTSDLSADEKYFYNFKTGAKEPGLEVIDLENLKLDHVIPMELDGPNGLRSPYVSHVYTLPDGTFYLSDNYEVYHFDQKGNKLSTLVYAKEEFDGEKLPAEKRIQLNETMSADGKTLLALYGGQKMQDSPEGLAIFDMDAQQVTYKPLSLFAELEKHQTVFYYEGEHPMQMFMAQIHLQLKQDSLLYSNSAQNKIFFYNLKTDSLTSKTYSSSYTSQEAAGNYPNRSDSESEFQEIAKNKEKEVNYGQLFFDKQNDVYWRFAKEMDRMKGDTIMYKTVLTAFDPEFNQLHEMLLPSDFTLPSKYFAREGMIYTFLNIDDEVAFVRLKPTISYE
ncbi:DUF4221 family protein [Algoriphagus chordae]|uniref:Uncharacterized protein DUF4221 n=1 Tax=Algoriphagus chordae TaxID=237019 RepID=A0A2W7S8X0_9BACT|nr:DUF4221 family protein [Algoriphagus chordae]PZX47012.1 uncharacterized protein DUF4221 [Algoriphagus chordae]